MKTTCIMLNSGLKLLEDNCWINTCDIKLIGKRVECYLNCKNFISTHLLILEYKYSQATECLAR